MRTVRPLAKIKVNREPNAALRIYELVYLGVIIEYIDIPPRKIDALLGWATCHTHHRLKVEFLRSLFPVHQLRLIPSGIGAVHICFYLPHKLGAVASLI